MAVKKKVKKGAKKKAKRIVKKKAKPKKKAVPKAAPMQEMMTPEPVPEPMTPAPSMESPPGSSRRDFAQQFRERPDNQLTAGYLTEFFSQH